MKRHPPPTALKGFLFFVFLALALFFGMRAWNVLGAEGSFVRLARGPAEVGELRGRAVLHGDGPGPICVAVRERFEACGKTKCWAEHGRLRIATGHADVDGQSIALGPEFTIAPESPAPRFARASARDAELRTLASSSGTPGFDGASSAEDRVVEWCAPDGEIVWIAACTKEGQTAPCDGRSAWVIALGDGTPSAAVGDDIDYAFAWVGAALGALSLAIVTRVRRRSPLARPLSTHTVGPGWRVFIPIAVAVALFGVLVALTPESLHDTGEPASRSAYGYGGQRFLTLVGLVPLIAVAIVALRRATVRRALGFVRASGAKNLAEADGAVTVFVRASKSEKELVRSVTNQDVVALSRAIVSERYGSGKSSRLDLVTPKTDVPALLAVEDDSGNATLDLRNASLDVETRRLESKTLPRDVKARFGSLMMNKAHTEWVVEEERIAPGEELFVLGEVTSSAVGPGDGGYRSTRRVPTLGSDAFPLVIYAGKRDELITDLAAETRAATLAITMFTLSLAVFAFVTFELAHW